MISVAVIGYGNLAFHLVNNFQTHQQITLTGVFARDINKLSHLQNHTFITDDINLLPVSDIYIISVSDTSIKNVSSNLKTDSGLVVHTSGATAMEVLRGSYRKGVLYPLQSFSKDKKIDFVNVPFCLEAENKEDLLLLESLIKTIGSKSYRISSAQRLKLHISAVFVNNFVNHLYKIGHDICQDNNIPFEILLPIIQETSKKVQRLTPKEAQTGPAVRSDDKTISKHLDLLNDNQKEIYNLLTQSIKNDNKL